jgi:hypothetical protein
VPAAWVVVRLLERRSRQPQRAWAFTGSTILAISSVGPAWLANGANAVALIFLQAGGADPVDDRRAADDEDEGGDEGAQGGDRGSEEAPGEAALDVVAGEERGDARAAAGSAEISIATGPATTSIGPAGSSTLTITARLGAGRPAERSRCTAARAVTRGEFSSQIPPASLNRRQGGRATCGAPETAHAGSLAHGQPGAAPAVGTPCGRSRRAGAWGGPHEAGRPTRRTVSRARRAPGSRSTSRLPVAAGHR